MAEETTQTITEFVKRLTDYMRINCSVHVTTNHDHPDRPVFVSVQADEDARLLIGKNGQNLQALEHVVRLAWMRNNNVPSAVTVDVNDYRKTQTEELLARVREAALRVRSTGRPEALDPMTSYERRIVHTELASCNDLATESIGQEPQRRVVIKPF